MLAIHWFLLSKYAYVSTDKLTPSIKLSSSVTSTPTNRIAKFRQKTNTLWNIQYLWADDSIEACFTKNNENLIATVNGTSSDVYWLLFYSK